MGKGWVKTLEPTSLFFVGSFFLFYSPVNLNQLRCLFDGLGAYERDNADDIEIDESDSDYEVRSGKSISPLRETGKNQFVFDEQEGCRKFAKFFCSAALPPQTVKDFYFRDFLDTVHPQFRCSVDDVGRYCLETYEDRPFAAFTMIMSSENILGDSTSSDSSEEGEEGEEESCDDDEEENHNIDDVYNLLPQYVEFIESTSHPPKSELDWYLEEPVLPWSHDFNALSGWRNASKVSYSIKDGSEFFGDPFICCYFISGFLYRTMRSDEKMKR
ncbi:hypothetical protein Acr_22g0009910 [Actinidia rufa]|uniref:Uncharacterized protein n=1 Tax=Actinidia rufa TaxID=165716 RepID=A0A7J0GLB1_9ERIC|nr:hypothetical protein Acr_22g0009910 [Actinidia rufa]